MQEARKAKAASMTTEIANESTGEGNMTVSVGGSRFAKRTPVVEVLPKGITPKKQKKTPTSNQNNSPPCLRAGGDSSSATGGEIMSFDSLSAMKKDDALDDENIAEVLKTGLRLGRQKQGVS